MPSPENSATFSQPKPRRLKELAEAGQFNTPVYCETHVPEEALQSIPPNVQAFGQLTEGPVTVVLKGGHNLGKDYVGPLLDRWLGPPLS